MSQRMARSSRGLKVVGNILYTSHAAPFKDLMLLLKIISMTMISVINKGVLHNGDAVAIKKMTRSPPMCGDKEFTSEITTIGNLVKLVGFAINENETLCDNTPLREIFGDGYVSLQHLQFTWSEIEEATNRFSREKVIGKGRVWRSLQGCAS